MGGVDGYTDGQEQDNERALRTYVDTLLGRLIG